jgi:dethiobiotin synthetase
MGKAYFITGTGTEIGKTIATSVLYLSLKAAGKTVSIFKPFQTGLLKETNTYPDISWYETELGLKDTGFYMLEPETSPHLAVKMTGTKVDVEKVIDRIHELEQQYDIVLVEGAGGLAVPLVERTNEFYMTRHLIKESHLPVILVSPSGLGSIHNAFTTYSYAKIYHLDVKTILFNFFSESDPIHRDNIETIQKLTGLEPFVCIPTFSNVKKDLKDYVSCMMKNNFFQKKLKEVFE